MPVLTPNTILQGHHCCMVSFALPELIVIALNKYKKSRDESYVSLCLCVTYKARSKNVISLAVFS